MQINFHLLPISVVLTCWFLSAPVTATAAPAPVPPPAPRPVAVDLTRAQALLKDWEETAPDKARRCLRIIYWAPADVAPAPQYRERLTRVMTTVRDFYAGQMQAYGFGPRTINLELEPDGMLKLRVVRGGQPSATYKTESGHEIRQDCVKVLQSEGINADDETLVIFCYLSKWDPEKRTMRQWSPYYASGTHHNGTAWQVDSPLLDSALLKDKSNMLTDGQYGHISVGRYNSIFVGGVAHELGHALGLPHCSETVEERKARGHALMGAGNRTLGEELRGEGPGTFLTFSHALKLASHVQFSGSVKRMADKAEVSWTNLQIQTQGQKLVVTGRIASTLTPYAILGYADPEGHGDYDSTPGCAVPAAKGDFRLEVPFPESRKAEGGELRLVACCVNGFATAYAGPNGKPTFPFAMKNGVCDVTPALLRQELDAALARQRKSPLTTAEIAALKPQTREVLRRLLMPDSANGKPEPVNVAAASQHVALSDCRPLTASTGWSGVHYDRLPNVDPILMCGGRIYPAGLYAHAPASHVYQLGGKWSRFTGRCGVADGGGNPVEFVILGDHRELWRSGSVKPTESKTFSVPVAGLAQLELQALVTPKGKNGAWGVWLEPTLLR